MIGVWGLGVVEGLVVVGIDLVTGGTVVGTVDVEVTVRSRGVLLPVMFGAGTGVGEYSGMPVLDVGMRGATEATVLLLIGVRDGGSFLIREILGTELLVSSSTAMGS